MTSCWGEEEDIVNSPGTPQAGDRVPLSNISLTDARLNGQTPPTPSSSQGCRWGGWGVNPDASKPPTETQAPRGDPKTGWMPPPSDETSPQAMRYKETYRTQQQVLAKEAAMKALVREYDAALEAKLNYPQGMAGAYKQACVDFAAAKKRIIAKAIPLINSRELRRAERQVRDVPTASFFLSYPVSSFFFLFSVFSQFFFFLALACFEQDEYIIRTITLPQQCNQRRPVRSNSTGHYDEKD